MQEQLPLQGPMDTEPLLGGPSDPIDGETEAADPAAGTHRGLITTRG